MTRFGQNLKFAFRQLLKSPGFTSVAVIIMALGIGANTAIFSVVRAVLLEPLPYSEPDRLVQIWHVPPQSSFPGMTRFAVSAANFLDWQKQSRAFEAMALYRAGGYDLSRGGKPESIRAGVVSSGFFSVLGVQPMLRTRLLSRRRPARQEQRGHPELQVLAGPLCFRSRCCRKNHRPSTALPTPSSASWAPK